MPPAARSVTIDRYIVDVLMADLIGHDRQPSAFLVYLYLYTRPPADGQSAVNISLRDIADATGLSRSVVQTAVRTLKRRQLVRVTAAHATAVPAYQVFSPWNRRPAGRQTLK